jgi:ElaB/YqjD/DUF883 family membrane-anchored ribosome-binding protein
MSTTTDRFGAQAKAVSDDLEEIGAIARDAAQEKLGQVRENATEYYEQGRDKVDCVVCTFGHYVRERPVKSVLVAAGIGLLFGRFWMRR